MVAKSARNVVGFNPVLIMIKSIRIEKGQLKALYWGESGTPEDWHTSQEIAAMFGCTTGAVIVELERHRIPLRSNIDDHRQVIWKFLTEEWGLKPEYGGDIFRRPVDFKLPRDEMPIAFVVHSARKNQIQALWVDIWEIIELPGRAQTQEIIEYVTEALERNSYKKVEPEEDDSHEIDW